VDCCCARTVWDFMRLVERVLWRVLCVLLFARMRMSLCFFQRAYSTSVVVAQGGAKTVSARSDWAAQATLRAELQHALAESFERDNTSTRASFATTTMASSSETPVVESSVSPSSFTYPFAAAPDISMLPPSSSFFATNPQPFHSPLQPKRRLLPGPPPRKDLDDPPQHLWRAHRTQI
jgi:hypothetical protein